MSGLLNGISFGAGSSVGHRVIDSVISPRTVDVVHNDGTNGAGGHKHSVDSASVPKPCRDETVWVTQCLHKPESNLEKCAFYFDLLKQCQEDMLSNQSQR